MSTLNKTNRVDFGSAINEKDKKIREALSSRCAAQALSMLSSKKKLFQTSGKFTHKCTCPSTDHKGGRESTPSFFVSAETGQFYCFGCAIFGNSFDLIALLGGDDVSAVRKAYDSGPIELPTGPSPTQVADKAHRAIVLTARNWMRSKIGSKTWDEDFRWIQNFYKKLDKVLKSTSEDDSPEAVYGRFLQLKTELKNKCKVEFTDHEAVL